MLVPTNLRFAVVTGIFECADPAAIVPNHDPAAVRLFSRFCNGLFVAVALNVDGNDGSSFVVMEKEAVKCHSRPPAFAAAHGRHGRGNMTEIKWLTPYPGGQIINAAMARALHADACRGHAAVAWVVLWDLPAYPERYAARLVTSGAGPFLYL
jgi:hypothetical protein